MGATPGPKKSNHSKSLEKPAQNAMTEKELEEKLVKSVEPPDGGWGWVIVFSSFMIHVIIDGITYSFGVLFVALLEDFQGSKGDTAWILSIFVGVTLGAGPIASILTNNYGCRAITIAGSVVGAFGFVISPFAPGVWYLYITFGLVAGFGFGMVYLPSIVIVSYYFEKRRALATGLACCGSGFGTFIFSPLTTILVQEFGWKQTCFWLAGILLQCCIFGALFRPLPLIDNTEIIKNSKEESKEEEKLNGKPDSEKLNQVNGKSDSEKLNQVNGKADAEAHVSPSPSAKHSKEGHTTPSKSRTSLNQIASIQSLNQQDLPGHQLKQHITLHRKDVFYSGSLHNIPLYNQNRAGYVASNMSLTHSLHQIRNAEKAAGSAPEQESGCKGLMSTLKSLVDFSLLKDWGFLLFLLSNLFTNFGFNAPFLFIPDRALGFGLTAQQGGLLLSIVGIANTVGRILFGWLADLEFIKKHRIHVYNTGLLAAGLATCFSYNESFAGQVAYAIGFGLFIGCYVSLTAVVLVDLLGVEKLTSSFGVTLLVQGVAVLIGPPACGWIYDATQSYTYPFVVMGACIALSGFMLYFLPCLSRFQHGDRRDTKEIEQGVRIAVQENAAVNDEEIALESSEQPNRQA